MVRSSPGWRGSGKRFRFSQICARFHAAVADVSPCLSDLGAPTALNERRGCVQERRSELFALKQEVEQTGQLWRHKRRPPPSSRKSCLRARKLCANSTALIMAVIEATQVKPPATLLAQSIMHDAHRNMRSWRARLSVLQMKRTTSYDHERQLEATYHRTRRTRPVGDSRAHQRTSGERRLCDLAVRHSQRLLQMADFGCPGAPPARADGCLRRPAAGPGWTQRQCRG